MTRPPHPGHRFTLWQLFAVVTVISVILAVLVPFVRWSQEKAREGQCANNLRLLALGMHEYHDVNNCLPPLATDPNHWTWAALILPYCYSPFAPLPQFSLPATTPGNLTFIRNEHYDSVYLCPERRITGTRTGGPYAGGQLTDYAAVSTTQALAWSPDSDGMIVFRRQPPVAGQQFARSATSLTTIADGTSNTLMIGEKHMRKDWLDGPYDEPVFVAQQDPNVIRVASDTLGRGLAQTRDDPDPWKFGSWHSGVVLFALGDASVHPIKKTTDPYLLRLLSCRNDGQYCDELREVLGY